jgi:hypothetical protein
LPHEVRRATSRFEGGRKMQKVGGRIVKILMAGAITAALGLPAGAASASLLGPPERLVQAIQVLPSQGAPGSAATVSGSGFLCASSVDVYWQYTKGDPIVTQYMGSSLVGRGGGFSITLRVPQASPGVSTVVAKESITKGSGSGSCQASTDFIIAYSLPPTQS